MAHWRVKKDSEAVSMLKGGHCHGKRWRGLGSSNVQCHAFAIPGQGKAHDESGKWHPSGFDLNESQPKLF